MMKRDSLKMLFAVCMIGVLLFSFVSIAKTTSTIVPTTAPVSGESYILSMTNIGDFDDGSKRYEYVALGKMSARPEGLDYALMPSSPDDVTDDFLWTITLGENNTCRLYAHGSKQYLNMKADFAYLSDTPQDLGYTMSDGKIQFWAVDNGVTYYLRFTNKYQTLSCWHAGSGINSSQFKLNQVLSTEIEEYDNTGKTPIYTVACFSDLHIDYGIQSWATPIRKGTIKAADFLRDEVGPVDVILVGGDVTSNNGKNLWTMDLWKKSIDTVYSTLASATKDGKVLFVSGNHENEAGINSGDTAYTGEYSPYMLNHVGAYTASLYFNDMEGVADSKFNELLCYRYSLNGMEFIGLNTPYRTSRSDGYIYPQQIDWLADQMKKIGPDKTVFVLCHYPVNNVIDQSKGTSSRTKLTTVLTSYPNIIYCYGHIHGSDDHSIRFRTSEMVTPYGNYTKNSKNAYVINGYLHTHMGSMGYYKTTYQPDWLGIDEPQVNQFLHIAFYDDHITFRTYNTGDKPGYGGIYEPASFTVMRDMSYLKSGSTSTDTSGSGSSVSTDTGNPTDTVTSTKTSTSTKTNTSTKTTATSTKTTATSTKTSTKTSTTVKTTSSITTNTGTPTDITSDTGTPTDTLTTDTTTSTNPSTATDTSTEVSTGTVTDPSTDTATDTSTDASIDTATDSSTESQATGTVSMESNTTSSVSNPPASSGSGEKTPDDGLSTSARIVLYTSATVILLGLGVIAVLLKKK